MGSEGMNAFDPAFMRRALELAKKGMGFTSPNPMVGAVIVKDGKIIAEGFHRRYGDLHAERDAFRSLSDKALAYGADLYVTLEPCCHTGKQPPCTEAVIAHGIKRVFVGSADPNPLVAGKGNELLRSKGIEVYEDCLREECDAINPFFFHYITKKRPYVTMKYAMTADGKIASVTGKSRWISGAESRKHVHLMRHKYSAILVGKNTALKDDPMLNVRLEGGPYKNPARVLVDSKLSISLSSKLVESAGRIPLYIACVKSTEPSFVEKAGKLIKAGARLLYTRPDEKGRVDLKELMELLGQEKIDSLLVEGGGEIHAAMLEERLVNSAMIYMAPKFFGGNQAPGPVGGCGIDEVSEAVMLKNIKYQILGEDLLIEGEVIYPCSQES